MNYKFTVNPDNRKLEFIAGENHERWHQTKSVERIIEIKGVLLFF